MSSKTESFDYESCITIWNQQWDYICEYLAKYPDSEVHFIDLLTDSTFVKVFEDILMYRQHFTVSGSEITRLFRGVCEDDPQKLTPDRFIPQWEYQNPAKPNRMNGADRLYSYFSITYDVGNHPSNEDLYYTTARELRISSADSFQGCDFLLANPAKLQFIDLRTRDKIPHTNKGFGAFLRREMTHGRRFILPSELDTEALTYWTIQAIFDIWENSSMFAPVDKSRSDYLYLQYRPFHMLCKHFENLGYDGIIYRSTMYRKGACLALFDVNNAVCEFETLCSFSGDVYARRK